MKICNTQCFHCIGNNACDKPGIENIMALALCQPRQIDQNHTVLLCNHRDYLAPHV